MELTIDWETLFTLMCINCIGALGYYVTLATGQLSMGHGALYAIGGYIGGLVAIHFHWPLPAYAAVAFVAAAIPGYLLAMLTSRLRGMYYAVATFAFGGAVAEAIGHIGLLGGPFGLGGIPLYTTLPVALATLVVVTAIVWRLDGSILYISNAAVRDDQDGALVLGIDVRRARRAAFAVGGGIAGISGLLYAGSTSIMTTADAGFDQALAFLLMVVIGGARSWRGPLLGAAIWTVLPEVLRFAHTWRMVIFGAAAILLMAVRPGGLIPRRIFRGPLTLMPVGVGGLGRALTWRPRTSSKAPAAQVDDAATEPTRVGG